MTEAAEATAESGKGGPWLLTGEGRDYLDREYVRAGRSSHDIAREVGTYPNRVLRALRAHGLEVRDHSKARLVGLATGRIGPPMLGRAHTEESKTRIREKRLLEVCTHGEESEGDGNDGDCGSRGESGPVGAGPEPR